jgi:hypothetical protein
VIVDGDCTSVAGTGNPAAPYIVNLELDPAATNQATCGPNGLFVAPPAAGDCITVNNSTVPAVISVEVDPDADNQLTCNPTGLFVPPSSIEVADTDCIDLNGTGSPGNPVTATPILSPDPANQLECVAAPDPLAGLRARAYVVGVDCVNVSGTGILADPYEVGLEISPDSGNVLECRSNGAYVPAVSQAAIGCRATLLHNGVLPTVLPPAAAGATSETFIDYDYIEESLGVIPHLGGGPAYPHTYIEIATGCGGIYLIQATHPAWSLPPNTAGDLILRLRLWRGTTAGGPQDGIGQTAQTRYTTLASPFNTPYLHVSRTILLSANDTVAVSFAAEQYGVAFAGAILDTGPVYGSCTPAPENCGLPFFQVTRLGVP